MDNLIFDKIQKTSDIVNMTYAELDALGTEIRKFLIESVSKTGGHLASNLGVVELTMALMRQFDFDKDKIIWDVGHQSYVYKMLTGRLNEFSTLRQYGGMSGFPKRDESKYDFFNTGHSSTSISAALGMARARELNNDDYNVIAVIGDGSISAGMAFEAMNDAGHFKKKMIVVLNDNQMSISANVGGLAKYLARFRVEPSYIRASDRTKHVLRKIPKVGPWLTRIIHNGKERIKKWITPDFIYEDLGFEYIGPVNGHDLLEVERALQKAKMYSTPVLVHVLTTKGKGYEYAENQPDKFHGIAPFEIETGEVAKPKSSSYSDVFGKQMIKLAEQNDKLTAVVAAMCDGTGLTEFANRFPKRFFDVGIAEQHAATMAAGLATEGIIPVVAVYSTFMQRAYDQLLHDVGLQNLHVVFALDRAGIVGADGETHQGVYDYSFAMSVPNVSILAPADYYELREMLSYAVNEHDGPIVIRYPRGAGKENICEEIGLTHVPVSMKKAEIIQEGADITIVSTGTMLTTVIEASKMVQEKGLSCEIINLKWIKPIDVDTVAKSCEKTGKLLVVEENTVKGGVASALIPEIHNVCFDYVALPDKPIQHGSGASLFKEYGLDAEGIVRKVESVLAMGVTNE